MILELLSIGIIYPVISLALGDLNLVSSISALSVDYLNTFPRAELLFFVLSILITIFLVKNTFMIIFIIYKSKFNEDFTSNLKNKLYDGYLKQEYTNFIKLSSSDIIRNINSEANVTTRVLDSFLGIFSELIVLSGIIIFLLFMAPLPTLIIISLSALFVLIYMFSFKKKFYLLGRERFKLDSEIISETLQGLGNFKEINIYNIYQLFLDKFSVAVVKMNKNLRITNVISKSARIILEQYGIFVIVILSYFVFRCKVSRSFSEFWLFDGIYGDVRSLVLRAPIFRNWVTSVSVKRVRAWRNNPPI